MKDNLDLIVKEQAPSQLDLEREAELTLLSITERLPNRAAKKQFCKENNVPWGEYKLLLDKWKYVLKAYQEQQLNQVSGDMIAGSINLALSMKQRETCTCCNGVGILEDVHGNEGACMTCNGKGYFEYYPKGVSDGN